MQNLSSLILTALIEPEAKAEFKENPGKAHTKTDVTGNLGVLEWDAANMKFPNCRGG
jgi:hypothetical protein